MGVVSTILGVLAVIAFFCLLFCLLIKIRIEGCKHCPHKKECLKAFETKDDHVPKCFQYENPFFNRYN